MMMRCWIALAALLAVIACQRETPEPAPPADVVAKVAVTPLRRDRITETISAYGTVVAAPGEAETFSVPFECRVRKVFVTPGLAIAQDTALLEIEPSPDTVLQLAEARSEQDSAANALQLVEQRVAMKLATRHDLLQAKQRLHDAQLRLASLKDRGIDGTRAIRATEAGVVSRIAVQPGAIVPAGMALVETIGQDQITIRIGVEDEDVGHLEQGQPVRILPVNATDGRSVDGRIHLITHQVNPETRLVDVFVSPAASAGLLLNEYVVARIAIAAHDALVVPRAAVLPDDGQYVVYTVVDGRAARHVVTI
jgi:membrane fusion protein (multidrug efflux system)